MENSIENVVSLSNLDHIQQLTVPTGHYMKDVVFSMHLLLLFYYTK